MVISKSFLDLFLDTRDTSCLILSTIYYFLLFFYSREIIREIIVSYCARLFSDRKAKDDSQDEKWWSKRISRREELANLFIQPRANVIVASYLKRRNPNDSWIAFYPIVDRNFHVRLPESLKEREREARLAEKWASFYCRDSSSFGCVLPQNSSFRRNETRRSVYTDNVERERKE